MTIRYFDACSGVGGFRAGLERAGGYECVGHSEINRHADRTYRRTYNIKDTEVFYEDITRINTDTLPDFDLLTAGCPCQPFSNAGKRGGFSDPRGTIFFDIARILGAKRPSYLLLENVPGLLSHDKSRTFAHILRTLSDLGYIVEWQIINSAGFVPQARKRLYIIGFSDKQCAGQVLPIFGANTKTPLHIVNNDCALLIKEATKRGYKEAYPGDSVDLAFPGQNTRRGRVGRGIAHTIDTGSTQGVMTQNGRIRRLTPRECFRLQGFYDEQIDKLLDGSSDTAAYKQAGNAVTVDVVHALAMRLKRAHEAVCAATKAEVRAA
jgi:DNA (cytosine-5)-methyltransferase 1